MHKMKCIGYPGHSRQGPPSTGAALFIAATPGGQMEGNRRGHHAPRRERTKKRRDYPTRVSRRRGLRNRSRSLLRHDLYLQVSERAHLRPRQRAIGFVDQGRFTALGIQQFAG